jgi:hypothetical protein
MKSRTALRRSRAGWAIVIGGALVTWASAACEDGARFCYPGDYRTCDCADETAGYERCDASGSAYGECDCSGNVPGLPSGAGGASGGSGGGGTAGAGGGGLLPFASPCDVNEECESGLCHLFNAKGTHCTMPCAGPEDCPPPSDGCNMMGLCKVP